LKDQILEPYIPYQLGPCDTTIGIAVSKHVIKKSQIRRGIEIKGSFTFPAELWRKRTRNNNWEW